MASQSTAPAMFLLIPIGVDYNARRYPVVTLTLIGINTAVYLVSFAYVLSGGAEARADLYSHYWLIPKLSLWHTYVTTWFVHAGLFHLLGNMIYLYLFGACVEDMIGRWQFVLLYCLGGLAADFAWIASAPGHFESILPLGGASGAITACIGGFLVLLHSAKLNFRWVFFFLRVWTDDFWISSSPVIALWFLSDLFFMLMGLGVKSSPGGVAFGSSSRSTGDVMPWNWRRSLLTLAFPRTASPAPQARTRLPPFFFIRTAPKSGLSARRRSRRCAVLDRSLSRRSTGRRGWRNGVRSRSFWGETGSPVFKIRRGRGVGSGRRELHGGHECGDQLKCLKWLLVGARINGRLCAVRGRQGPGVPAFNCWKRQAKPSTDPGPRPCRRRGGQIRWRSHGPGPPCAATETPAGWRRIPR